MAMAILSLALVCHPKHSGIAATAAAAASSTAYTVTLRNVKKR